MSTALILVALLVAIVAIYLWKRPSAPPAPAPRDHGAPPAPPAARAAAQQRIVDNPLAPQPLAATSPPVVPERPLPTLLADFQLTSADTLPPAQREALQAELRRIPRPPRSLHRLISPEFIASASSSEMSELVLGEPVIAAKVLSTVNSPLYGLQKTVTSIGQAITFLGMNTVRGISLQYMLDESFKADNADTRRAFEQLWTASALASELCTRLAKQLPLSEAGALVTQVVLSFVGHMAVAALAQGRGRPEMTDLSLDLPQRYRAQQATLGLCAPEIGRLLMREWELPSSIVEGVGQIEQVLMAPVSQARDAAEAPRQAVAYLCARLGERMACGGLDTLAGIDLAQDERAELHHLQGYLRSPRLATLGSLLTTPDNVASVSAFLASRTQAT
ncbi:HDOD domain-containing protein [Hydrogenophaga sp. OTU3427]|uniref:HDOD domain-containing protein n=1 Tax=Hydrogenophaga sp. OTU3427 TaxID=3043856 RepID=UPI00313CF31A